MSVHEQIREIILHKHKGKKNAIKSHTLAEEIGIDPGPSKITIRTLITETIQKLNIPIGADSHGYFLIENKEELKNYFNHLESRKNGIENRKLIVYGAYARYYENETLTLTSETIDHDEEK